MSEKIRIKLKSYDHNLVDKSAEKIVKTINAVKEDKVVVVTYTISNAKENIYGKSFYFCE